MAQQVTLGGDRLGSGNKQKVSLHNYEMSSFNLEQDWKSTMAPGVLYPFLKLVGTNHDTFDIDLDTMIRTLPTKGPLFGSFKFQVDVFSCPMRLYQGILHNNPINIGLKMNQVLLPMLKIKTNRWSDTQRQGATHYNYQINESSLLKYLGLSGLGEQTKETGTTYAERKINAIPALAYYDIFKNYYANKQEENAYVISPGNIAEEYYYANVEECRYVSVTNGIIEYTPSDGTVEIDTASMTTGEYAALDVIQLKFEKPIDKRRILVEGLPYTNYGLAIAEPENPRDIEGNVQGRGDERNIWWLQIMPTSPLIGESTNLNISTDLIENNKKYASDIALIPFPIKNIDDMRNAILSDNTLGSQFVIQKNGLYDWLPYSQLVAQFEDGISYNAFPMNGLVVKTYQSDLFNNWLDSEIIDGTNGISALSAITVDEDGKFTMDQLNLAQKVYDVLNRIAVTGGTYEDWQEAVWGEGAIRKAETPMYMGGMAAEIMFEEVISTSESNVDNRQKALGSLAGKGREAYPRGGRNIHIKCEEPTYIIGICSITPRIAYSQGNDWDMIYLNSLDDLHKPALDGIGFQDLMVEQFAWWARKMYSEDVTSNPKAGKQTAWINYQTAVDKCYGEFANQDGYSFMVLNRNYEYDETDGSVKDVTTYIDPAKYNYAFTYADLDAQNFWVQLHSRIIARRKMGAQQIPNL